MNCAATKILPLALGERPRIDLEWAKQKIHGFAEMVATQQRVRDSEAEYKAKYGALV